jgi:signal transduction histidine kinase
MTTALDQKIVRATLDGDGLLRAADAPLLALQLQAGGDLGLPLLVPQLAALARLTARLGVGISRPALVAGATVDIDMWVQTRIFADGVALSIVDWRERPARLGAGHGFDADALAAIGWHWQLDNRMRFVLVDAGERADFALPRPGMPLTGHFQLLPDAEGDLGLLHALAQHQSFSAQRARLVAPPQSFYRLSGRPMFDMAGRLIGYRGTAVPESEEIPEAELIADAEDRPAIDVAALFGRRIDRALRQPLGRIIANADTIAGQLEGPLRQDYATYAADIAVAGRHLLALVEDLADLQAVERPGFTTIDEEVDLGDIARRASGLLAVRARERGIVIAPPQSDEHVLVRAEFRRVLQILVNLIGNAVRYSPEGASVWVRIDQEDDIGRVIVADQGRGIAVEDQERIFDKFERLGRDEPGGSGLGLYISRRLARAMRGDIMVESAPGQGARFTLSLPVAG